MALVLSDNLDAVPLLLAEARGTHAAIDPAAVWAYVGTRELRARWNTTELPVLELAELIVDLGSPPEYSDLVCCSLRKNMGRRRSPEGLLTLVDERIAADRNAIGLPGD